MKAGGCTGRGLGGSRGQELPCPHGVGVCHPPGTQMQSTPKLSVASGFLCRLRHLSMIHCSLILQLLSPPQRLGVRLKVPNFFSWLGFSCDKLLS